MTSCSTRSASSVSLRTTRQSWLNTSKPLAPVSSATSEFRPAKCRLSARMPDGSLASCLSGLSSARAAAPSGQSAGLCKSSVTAVSPIRLASRSISTFCWRTLNCGSSTTLPSTLTQPPAMYCSASRREHASMAATRLASRSSERGVSGGGFTCAVMAWMLTMLGARTVSLLAL